MKNLAMDYYKSQQRKNQGVKGFRIPKKPTKAQGGSLRGQLLEEVLDLSKVPDNPPEGIPGNQDGQRILLLAQLKKGILSLDWKDVRVVKLLSEHLSPEMNESSIVISDEWEKEPHLEVLIQGIKDGNVMQAKMKAVCPKIGDNSHLGLDEMPDVEAA